MKTPAFLRTTAARSFWVAAALYGLLIAIVFGDALFSSGSTVLSSLAGDLPKQYIPWRLFGFGELRQGNLPLWNPYIFSGAPFFSGFQSALVYPLNWMFLILPLSAAINWSIAIHIFLAGIFMRQWALYRGLSPAASCFCGAMLMFCGPHFPHVFAGHLSNLCVIPWVPVLFWAIDGWMRSRRPSWCLLGAVSIALQVFAGNPQYVFYTGVAATLYSLLSLPGQLRFPQLFAGLGAMALGGAALSAVQLLPGILSTADSMRSGGVDYQFAAMFSFPPENLITLVAPGFFGAIDITSYSYWGRAYLWEMSLFFGISGLMLALLGGTDIKRNRVAIIMVLVLFTLALGSHTPLFDPLYRYLPGFSHFRGWSKFTFQSGLFFILLAGTGFDRIARGNSRIIQVCVAAAGVPGAGLCVCAWMLYSGGGKEFLKTLMAGVEASRESYLPAAKFSDPAFLDAAVRGSAISLAWAGGTLLLLAAALYFSRRGGRWTWGVLALGIIELTVFARGSVTSFHLSEALGVTKELTKELAKDPGDYRILNLVDANGGMVSKIPDIWGYDALSATRRYAEYITFSQGGNPDQPTPYVQFHTYNKLLALLRCRYTVEMDSGSTAKLRTFEETLPRMQLFSNFLVINGRDNIFTALLNPTFNLSREVILEEPPVPLPQPVTMPGSVRLLASSTDHMDIEADLVSPALLVVSDTFSPDWKIRPLPGSTSKQSHYSILPADYVLRAIPLEAGKHVLRMEYIPAGFVAGCWITLSALLLLVVATGFQIRFIRISCASGKDGQ